MRVIRYLGMAASAAASIAVAQVTETKPFVEPQNRFSGVIETRVQGKPATVRVDYKVWSIGPGLRLERLPQDARGEVLYELHSGKLTTRTGDQPVDRKPGSFWVVGPGEQQSLQTYDDMVVLRTIAVLRLRTPKPR